MFWFSESFDSVESPSPAGGCRGDGGGYLLWGPGPLALSSLCCRFLPRWCWACEVLCAVWECAGCEVLLCFSVVSGRPWWRGEVRVGGAGGCCCWVARFAGEVSGHFLDLEVAPALDGPVGDGDVVAPEGLDLGDGALHELPAVRYDYGNFYAWKQRLLRCCICREES